MTNILLTLVLLSNIALLLVFLLSILRVKRVFGEVKAFLTPESEGKPSPLAITVSNISLVFARAITAQVKTTLMGLESGNSRAEKAVQGDLALDIAKQTGIGALLTQFPTVAKHIRKNPGLVDAALEMFSKMQTRQPDAGSNGHIDELLFKL